MNKWEEWQLQFDKVLDGGYRYLDQCGLFMAALREQFGFMPTNVNPSGCAMEAPDYAFVVQASVGHVSLICSNMAYKAEFLEASKFCSEQAIKLFEPFSVYQDRFLSRNRLLTESLESSFKLSLANASRDIGELGKLISMTPYNQDRTFNFKSGSQDVFIKINPMALGITQGERKLPVQGTPRELSKFFIKREQNIEKTVRPPGYALNLELILTETEPAADHSLDEQLKTLQEYRSVVVSFLSA
jgi:hypothetical protein